MSLFSFERRWILAIFAAILPSRAVERLPVGAADLPLDRFIDDVMRTAPLRAALGIRVASWLVMFAPLFMIGRCRTFTGLEPEARTAMLVRMAGSPRYVVREIPTLFKMLAALGYGGSPAVLRQVGIDHTDAPAPAWIHDAS